eukprot:GHRQ01001751.1.p2 GENE.GHRQ01001751.1~~GHRQ01001751.1.p2  ORF type:complete len:193 (+),score=68.34 GHRQ01001751.1:366-944(+)
MDGTSSSIFVQHDAPVYDMPVSAINRPLPSTLDPAKVQQFVTDMQAGAAFTPIEVAWVQEDGENYYFAFGGCHRWAAVQQLGLPTIRARLIRVSASSIATYLGASSPFRRQGQQQQQQQPQHSSQPQQPSLLQAPGPPQNRNHEQEQQGMQLDRPAHVQQQREQEELQQQLAQQCRVSERMPGWCPAATSAT